MNFQEACKEVKKRLSPKRFIHTMGVVESATMLAKRYEVDIEEAQYAALLHDVAKELPLKEMQKRLGKEVSIDEEVYNNGALLHGPIGAIVAAEEFHITNPSILEAIRVHTTGKAHMSTLDKIIFLADYIEPNREFPGVDLLRETSKENLDKAVLMAYDSTIRHLLDQGVSIYGQTLWGRNDILNHMRRNHE